MAHNITVDLITDDPIHGEFVLHLVEEGPWDVPDTLNRMRVVQNRLYDTVDLVVDGHLAGKYPESKGRNIRIQIDCLDEPKELHELVARFSEHMQTDADYRKSIDNSPYVSRLRITANKLDP
jgi:hypothetical protein